MSQSNALREQATPSRKMPLALWITLAAAIAWIQCLSIWNYHGEKVDESEIFHFAIGFLGGDLDPKWYGYGSFSMYLLGVVYAVLGAISILIGHSASLLEFASFAYDSGFFAITARLVFALIGAVTVLSYIRLGQITNIPPPLLVVFFVDSLLSPDGLAYANYVRCDQVVACCTSLLLLFLFSAFSRRVKVLALSILVAVATATKISAIPLMLIPAVFCVLEFEGWKLRFKSFLCSTIVFLLVFHILSPYSSIFHQLWLVTQTAVLESRVTFSKPGYYGFVAHSQALFAILGKNLGTFAALSIFCIPALLLISKKLFVYSLVALFSLSAPYYFGTEMTEYWFLPVFPLLRFVGIAGIAGLVSASVRYWKIPAKPLPWIAAVACLLAACVPNYNRYMTFRASALSSENNAGQAASWLEQHASESSPVLLDVHYNYVLPRFYGTTDISPAKEISRGFIYYRNHNKFLNEAFELFYHTRYVPKFKGRQIEVRFVQRFDATGDSPELARHRGAIFVTSPFIYNRFLQFNRTDLTAKQQQELSLLKSYYQDVLSWRLLARFAQPHSPVIEMYEVGLQTPLP